MEQVGKHAPTISNPAKMQRVPPGAHRSLSLPLISRLKSAVSRTLVGPPHA
jgi:hypothetical protein